TRPAFHTLRPGAKESHLLMRSVITHKRQVRAGVERGHFTDSHEIPERAVTTSPIPLPRAATMTDLRPPTVSDRAGVLPRLLHGGGDVLGLQELVDTHRAAFAADARLLHTAERGRRIGHDALVQPDHAGLQRLAHPQRAVDV